MKREETEQNHEPPSEVEEIKSKETEQNLEDSLPLVEECKETKQNLKVPEGDFRP